jgi:hypothetical protein
MASAAEPSAIVAEALDIVEKEGDGHAPPTATEPRTTP